MQNKHHFFLLFLAAQLTGRAGGGALVGPNAKLFPKMHFEGPPNIIKIDHLVDDFSKNATC